MSAAPLSLSKRCGTFIIHIINNMDLTARARLSRACRDSAGKTQRGAALRQMPLLFRQIGDQLGVADCQRKLELVFQPGFLQHIRHVEFDR